jgi:hypothetical protein
MNVKKIVIFGLVFFGSIILFQYWYFSQTWTGVISHQSESGSYKIIGTFRDLKTCMIESAQAEKDSNNSAQQSYFCGRACVVDSIIGAALIDDFRCAEKHFRPNKIDQ